MTKYIHLCSDALRYIYSFIEEEELISHLKTSKFIYDILKDDKFVKGMRECTQKHNKKFITTNIVRFVNIACKTDNIVFVKYFHKHYYKHVNIWANFWESCEYSTHNHIFIHSIFPEETVCQRPFELTITQLLGVACQHGSPRVIKYMLDTINRYNAFIASIANSIAFTILYHNNYHHLLQIVNSKFIDWKYILLMAIILDNAELVLNALKQKPHEYFKEVQYQELAVYTESINSLAAIRLHSKHYVGDQRILNGACINNSLVVAKWIYSFGNCSINDHTINLLQEHNISIIFLTWLLANKKQFSAISWLWAPVTYLKDNVKYIIRKTLKQICNSIGIRYSVHLPILCNGKFKHCYGYYKTFHSDYAVNTVMSVKKFMCFNSF